MQEGDIAMVPIHLPSRDHPRSTWVGLLAVLILAALPLLAASTFSAPVAQTLHPVSYLPLLMGPPYYRIALFSFRDRNPNEEIYVMNADGSNQTNLTNNPAADDYPFWSPDGRQIAFVSNQTNLTNNPARFDGSPVWSIQPPVSTNNGRQRTRLCGTRSERFARQSW
jgi:dipeptidyl aminopeptidase/acylaminoacyl peptidase